MKVHRSKQNIQRLSHVPQNSKMTTNYNSKVSLQSGMVKMNSLKQFKKHTRENPSMQIFPDDYQGLGQKYLSNLKDNSIIRSGYGTPKEIPKNRALIKGNSRIGSRSRGNLKNLQQNREYYEGDDGSTNLYGNEQNGSKLKKNRKHQKSTSLVEENLLNLYQQTGPLQGIAIYLYLLHCY